MHASRPTRQLRPILVAAALGLLAALFMLQTPHIRADSVQPFVQGWHVNGSSLVLIYGELLDETSVPATSKFTVNIDGTDYTPASVAVQGAEVHLTLSTAAAMGDTVTYAYNRGGTGDRLQDPSGNLVDSQTDPQTTPNYTGSTNRQPVFAMDEVTLTVDENTATGMNVGSPVAATDDDGDSLLYEFQSGFSAFTVDGSTGQVKASAALDFESGTTTYVAVLYVRDNKGPDGGGNSLEDDTTKVTISVNDVNEPPAIGTVLLAGDRSENTPTSEVLATYTANDPESGDTLTWSLGGADANDFTIGSQNGELRFSAVPDYESPADQDTNNAYHVTVQVSDGKNAQGGTDTTVDDTVNVTITVRNQNEPPEITSTGMTHTAISAPEGTATTEILATYVGNDPESGDTLTWSLGGADAGDFTITPTGFLGELKFKAVPDFENQADSDTNNVYNVTVQVRDSKINTPGSTNGNADTMVDDTINVVVTVTNIDEAGAVTLPGTITAGQAVTATLTDPDGTTSSESWVWSISDTAGGTFTPITGATSNPYTPVAADLGKYLKAAVTYTDPHGSGKSATSAASSQVQRGNVDPSFSSMTATRSVPENTASNMNVGTPVSTTDNDGDTLEYRLTGTDAGSFSIEMASGQIKTSAALNFESKSSYSVVVEVRDKKDDAGATDAEWDDTIDVTINLSNVDEAGTVTIAGTESGGETLTATVTDIDGTPTNVTWQWARGASASGSFMTISGATNSTYTTVAADVTRFLRATASYTDPQGSGKSASAVTGQISASNNEPAFPSSETGSRSVPENSGTGTDVGAPVVAEDDDSGDTLFYSISGGDASSFTVDSATGQIKTKMNVTYDYEGTAIFGFSLHVRDSKDAAGNPNTFNDDTINVTITLTDVNEQPTIETTTTAISVAENQTSVLTYMADDEDNNEESNDSANTLTWSVETADDGSFFEIGSSSGVLTFKNAPNFEDKQDAGADNVYNVTVTVTDNGIDGARGASNHLSVSKSLAVTVTDVNETPTLTTAPSFRHVRRERDGGCRHVHRDGPGRDDGDDVVGPAGQRCGRLQHHVDRERDG